MGRGWGWGDVSGSAAVSTVTPTLPSPIEGEGFGSSLDQLDVPVAEGAPDEMVDGVGHVVEAELVERAVELGERLDHLADDPAVDRKLGGRRGDAVARADAVHLQEARGVPQLGREVAVALDPLLIELDVAALAFHRRQGEAQRVGAIFVDQAERVDGVALGLGHLLPVRVADQAVEVERLPRRLLHQLDALHRHPRVPEEQDVEAGDEDVIGVMALEVLGLLGPAEGGEGPQR